MKKKTEKKDMNFFYLFNKFEPMTSSTHTKSLPCELGDLRG